MRQRIRGSKFKASPGQIVCITLSGKYPSQKRVGGVALSSSSSTAKEKKRERAKDTAQW
jgi:hypothetical protein